MSALPSPSQPVTCHTQCVIPPAARTRTLIICAPLLSKGSVSGEEGCCGAAVSGSCRSHCGAVIGEPRLSPPAETRPASPRSDCPLPQRWGGKQVFAARALVTWCAGTLPQPHPFSGWTGRGPGTQTRCSSQRLERSRDQSPAFRFSLGNCTHLQTVDGWLSPPVRSVTGLS